MFIWLKLRVPGDLWVSLRRTLVLALEWYMRGLTWSCHLELYRYSSVSLLTQPFLKTVSFLDWFLESLLWKLNLSSIPTTPYPYFCFFPTTLIYLTSQHTLIAYYLPPSGYKLHEGEDFVLFTFVILAPRKIPGT